MSTCPCGAEILTQQEKEAHADILSSLKAIVWIARFDMSRRNVGLPPIFPNTLEPLLSAAESAISKAEGKP